MADRCGRIERLGRRRGRDRLRHGGDDDLIALDADTGDEQWRYGGFGDEAGVLFSPVVAGGEVYVLGNHLYVVDAGTGRTVTWYDIETLGGEEGGPVPRGPVSVANGDVYVPTYDPYDTGNLHAITGTDPEGDGPTGVDVTVSPDKPGDCNPTTLTASAQDDDGGDYFYRWDIGNDGSIDEETDGSLSRQFDTGRQTVRVVAVDRWGRTAEATTAFTVRDCGAAPQAHIEVLTDDPTAGEAVKFRGSASGDVSGDVTYTWRFYYAPHKSSGPIHGQEVTETFTVADGSATLVVEDEQGQTGKTEIDLTIAGGDNDDGC